MNNKPNILVVIPARGGSKGIPRKNLRSLNNRPLIYYSITNALASTFKPDVYVSSEDDEILTIAAKIGAKTFKRDESLSNDSTTLDPVIYQAYNTISELENKQYDLIVTMQPTSPLLKTRSLDEAIEQMLADASIDTIISAINDTHLTWLSENDAFKPNYEERLNRQYLPPVYKETGSFLITRGSIIEPNKRIGDKVSLYELSKSEAIDIDNYEDWSLCEYYLSRKSILFVVTGYDEIGLGHTYNTLSIANEILNHELLFLVDKKSQLALDKIKEFNYPVRIQQQEDILDDIFQINPDLVINDRLDTSESYMKALKEKDYQVVNFEDLGSGVKYADTVINAMYPEEKVLPNHYFGHSYFCLKNEFYVTPPISVKPEVKQVLISFGGVDPNNFTNRVAELISQKCIEMGINITIIAGMGYDLSHLSTAGEHINVVKDVKNISDFMAKADLAFTSAGRTTFELASLGVPSIVLCQNEREMTHFFANESYGFKNLGMGVDVSDREILKTFSDFVSSFDLRQSCSNLMLAQDIQKGKQKVIRLIQKTIERED